MLGELELLERASGGMGRAGMGLPRHPVLWLASLIRSRTERYPEW